MYHYTPPPSRRGTSLLSILPQLATATALLASIALCPSLLAGGNAFDQFIGFGDSTMDSGYFRYHTTGSALYDGLLTQAIPLGATGGWTGNGIMNTVILAGKFGLDASPIDHGGSNYANGGTTTLAVPLAFRVLPGNVATIPQIQNYLSAVQGAANPGALYMIRTGDNDVDYFITKQEAAWRAANPTYLSGVATALAVEVKHLQSAGARIIMVPNTYDSAVYAGLGGDIPAGNAAEYAMHRDMGTSEWAALKAEGVHFIPVDNNSLFKYIVHNPTLFGFTASSVLSAEGPAASSSALIAILTPAEQRDYLFVDRLHLTTAGQTIEADYAYSLLIAPNQISLLAESAVQTGSGRTAAIQDQLDLSAQRRGSRGINTWATAEADSQSFRNAEGFEHSSGTHFGGAMGVDYRLYDGLLVGMAFSMGRQTQDFSTGGNFKQRDEALSVYIDYRKGPLWGNMVGTYGLLHDKVSRLVTLGVFTDQNQSTTTGHSLALALRGGSDFKLGRFTTGPVLGLSMQEVHIASFTESGTSGVSALSFGRQTRDSAISQVGWRALVDLGKWQPFAEAKWNHEWDDKNRMVSASLTTVDAPVYSMDAVPSGTNWASASLGTAYKLSPRTTLRAALSAELLNPQVRSYGGDLSLTMCF
jgi:outer membrane lipase/esterase